MNWQAVTFVTEGTGYVREVERLKASAEVCGVPLRVFTFANAGSWRANLNFKSRTILDAMAEYADKDIVFVDADAVIRSYPTLFDTLSEERRYDIAVHFLRDVELLSGTLWLRNGETGRDIVRRWHALGERFPQQRHQHCLHMALRAMAAGGARPLLYKLPIEYTCIFDHPLRAGKTAVIEHFQASRKYRRRLTPPKPRPPIGGPFNLGATR